MRKPRALIEDEEIIFSPTQDARIISGRLILFAVATEAITVRSDDEIHVKDDIKIAELRATLELSQVHTISDSRILRENEINSANLGAGTDGKVVWHRSKE